MDERSCRLICRYRAVRYDPSLNAVSDLLPCEGCGRWQILEAHHRQFRSRGGLWVPSNILLLCNSCHRAATLERIPPDMGWNVHSWNDPKVVPVRVWYASLPVLFDDEGGFTGLTKTDK